MSPQKKSPKPPAKTSAAAAAPAPTSADVARLAGVSRATVSFVLNDTASGRVSEQTREKVRAAAARLGYVPHAAARSLRAGRTGLVLISTPDVPMGPLFSDFFSTLRSGLGARGYTVALYGDPATNPLDAARRWAELRPAAVLAGVYDSLTPEAVALLRRSGTPAVFTLGPVPVAGAHSLIMDQTAVGRIAGEHLLAQGHRRVGVVVPTDRKLDWFSLDRLQGVREAMSAHPGIRLDRIDLDYTEEAAANLAHGWLHSGLTGLFAYNDEYAALIQSAFLDAGVRMPQDAALVGADDLMLSRIVRPRLTTVRQVLFNGPELVDLVDDAIRHPERPPLTRTAVSSLIVRESS